MFVRKKVFIDTRETLSEVSVKLVMVVKDLAARVEELEEQVMILKRDINRAKAKKK